MSKQPKPEQFVDAFWGCVIIVFIALTALACSGLVFLLWRYALQLGG